jgi:hypothetical protein
MCELFSIKKKVQAQAKSRDNEYGLWFGEYLVTHHDEVSPILEAWWNDLEATEQHRMMTQHRDGLVSKLARLNEAIKFVE